MYFIILLNLYVFSFLYYLCICGIYVSMSFRISILTVAIILLVNASTFVIFKSYIKIHGNSLKNLVLRMTFYSIPAFAFFTRTVFFGINDILDSGRLTFSHMRQIAGITLTHNAINKQ